MLSAIRARIYTDMFLIQTFLRGKNRKICLIHIEITTDIEADVRVPSISLV